MKIKNIVIYRYFPRAFEQFAVHGKKLIGVEIGVYRGEHLLSMLKNLDVRKIYAIDPYLEYSENGMTQHNLSNAQKIMLRKLGEEDRVEIIYKKSSKAHEQIPNDLDFVYIDGSHDYENVKRDINIYYEKVKIGGVFGGDDFFNGYGKAKLEHTGLINAVLEFINKFNLQLYISGREWWVIKK